MKEQFVQEPLAGLAELEAIELQGVPIAVHLGDRALALETIMSFYNVDKRVAGSAKAVTNYSSRFCRLYGKAANDVQQGAERNRRELLPGFHRAVEILAATDAMRANGYDEADSGLATIVMQHDLNVAYGAKSEARAADRNELTLRAQKLAETLGALTE
jgi:hypothetical protein